MAELERITETEMRELLRRRYSQDPDASLLGQLARYLCDSARSSDENRGFHIHPLCLTLGLILFSIVCVFLYFSFVTR